MGLRRMPRVYLIRHGETEWSLNADMQAVTYATTLCYSLHQTGTTDIPLTANGERMVGEMGPRMVGQDKLIHPEQVRHIFVSPRQRAQRTAQLMFAENPLPNCVVTTDPEVAEWDYGKYEGMLTKDIRKEKPNWDIWTDGCPPGETPGESPEQMTARVDHVIARIREIHAQATAESNSPEKVEHSDVIIFSHGHFTRSFIARWCDLPITAGYHFAADAGGLAVLGYQHSSLKEPSLLGLNWYTEEQIRGK